MAGKRWLAELFASWVIDGKTRETNSIPAGPYQQMDEIQVPFPVRLHPASSGAGDAPAQANAAEATGTGSWAAVARGNVDGAS
jgi:hypothetical protein